MFTSYHNKSGRSPNAISISGRAPDWYSGREYKILAPKLDFFQKYKKDGDEEYYTKQFKERVLGPLDPNKVVSDLGTDAILMCWEKPGEFCHRRLVADWLFNEIGLIVPELELVEKMKEKKVKPFPFAGKQTCRCCGETGYLKILVSEENDEAIHRHLDKEYGANQRMHCMELTDFVSCYCQQCGSFADYPVSEKLFTDGVVRRFNFS